MLDITNKGGHVAYSTIKQEILNVSNTIPVGISGLLILGVSIEDWVLIGTGIVLLGNLYFLCERFYKRFSNHGK